MCGVVGIYNSRQKINLTVLNQARDILHHRGPDGKGTWVSTDEQVGLAHTRLSIVDAKGGAQPILNREKTVCASVNGEFYDYDQLRKKLESKGYIFTTKSDSELVIHLYEEYELDFVSYLRGEFAFVLYDQYKKRMIAVRDRFGIKPLCYYHSNDGIFYVASEAKALFELGIKPAWNEYALYHSFCFQYPPLDQTLFKNIQQVQPGHMMIFNGNDLITKQYWDLNYSPIDKQANLEFNTLSEELDTHLREAIGVRLHVDDSHLCCHLSGGVDSATIAVISSELYGRPLPCFSVSFPHENYNEIQFAERLATKIGAPFHPVFVGAEDMVNVLSDAVYYTEGLAINNHLSAKYILNREIKKAGFKVALTGEGADELFAGYLHLQQDYSPHQIAHNIASGIYVSNDQTLPLDSMKERLGFIPTFVKAKAAIGHKLNELLDHVPFMPEQVIKNISHNHDQLSRSNMAHDVEKSTYLWIKFALSNYILRTLGDGCEMAHGIEGRTPFLDHHLFDFSKKIPLAMKFKTNTDKYILRETVKKYLTPEIIQRKKQPFLAPPLSLLTNKKGYEFMRDCLYSSSSVPFLNNKKMTHYMDTLPKKPIRDQIAAEPVMMLLLTATLLGQRYAM